jgi:hypothetical protein
LVAVPHHRVVRLRWDAAPWLLVPVPFLVAPAATLWGSAALQAVGMGRPLDAVLTALGPSAGTDAGLGTRILFLVLFVGLPAVAFALAFFAFFSGELVIDDWTVDARLRLPRPPWSVLDVIGAGLLIFTLLLTLAVVAHGISG